MKQNIIIRKRKSVKKGVTYEYRFETASIGGQRKWISKGGFEDENTARIEGIKALNQYNTCGKVEEPTKMGVADFLEHWLVNDCAATLSEITMNNYRKKIKNLIVPHIGKFRMNMIDRDKLQNLLIILHDSGYSYNTIYPHMQSANITRLMYFATFCTKDGYVMRNLDIKSTLLINANQIKCFRDELFDDIIYNDKGCLSLNRNCFCKGEIREDSQNYTRLFTQSTRLLYESCDTSAEHKSLSYIFRMIPYVNRQTNILCINQQEQVIDSVQKMSFSEYCEYMGFDKSHASRLRNRLLNYRIDGELVVGFFDDLERLNSSGKYVVVNPMLYYGGDRTQQNYSNIRKLFIDEKNTFSSQE